MSVTPFPSQTMTPRQALLYAEEAVDEMDHVAIVYMVKGESHPRLTVSSCMPVDINFLGVSLQHYSLDTEAVY